MINVKTVTKYETSDGKLFDTYIEASEHSEKLDRKVHIEQLRKLEIQQRLDKKALRDKYWGDNRSGYYYREYENQKDLQRKVQEQTDELRRLLKDLQESK